MDKESIDNSFKDVKRYDKHSIVKTVVVNGHPKNYLLEDGVAYKMIDNKPPIPVLNTEDYKNH